MKTIKSMLLVLLAMNLPVNAQEENIRNRFSFGFQIGQYQPDFAIGINLTSPFFAHRSVGVRLRANMAFHEHETPQQVITWTPYTNLSLGMIGVGGIINDKIRVYGEGGFVLLLPSPEFSNENFSAGGYGVFGFEFFMVPFMCYFIEIGGIGTGAIADKVPKQPIYSNGLMLSAGFRASL